VDGTAGMQASELLQIFEDSIDMLREQNRTLHAEKSKSLNMVHPNMDVRELEQKTEMGCAALHCAALRCELVAFAGAGGAMLLTMVFFGGWVG
jgi:hypothetical protein